MRGPRQCCEHRLNGLKKCLVGVAVAASTALLGQSMVLAWWASTITTRGEYVEKAVDWLGGRVHNLETARPSGR